MKLFWVPRSGATMLLTLLALAPLPAWGQEGPIPLLPAPAPRMASQANLGGSTTVTAATETVTMGSAATMGAAAGSLRTTTDSAEYCTELHGRVDILVRDAKTPKAEQALSLSQEGERLCKHGQMRSGILHLRRAFILTRPPEGSPEAGR